MPPLCPHCAVELRNNRRKTFLCGDCLGLFVPRDSMKTVLAALRDGHNIEAATDPYRGMLRSDARVDERSRYVKCPTCDDLMNRTELIAGAGVVVDMCLVDGVWFARGEFSHAANVVAENRRGKGREDAERAALEVIASALGRFFRTDDP